MRQTWNPRPSRARRTARGSWFTIAQRASCSGWPPGSSGRCRPRSRPPRASAAAAKAEAPAAPRRRRAAAAAAAPPAAGRPPRGRRRRAAENMLQWAIRASGPIGLFLLCLSVYFTALVIRLFMEFRVSEAVPAPWSRSSRPRSATRSSRTPTTPAATTTRSWPGWSAPAIANLPNGRPEAKEAMNGDVRRDRHRHGDEDQLPGDHRHARPDDRPGRHDLGHDHELPGDRHRRRRPAPAREGGRGDLDGAVHHARRRLAVGPGDLLLRLLPQPDRPDDDGSQPRSPTARSTRWSPRPRPPSRPEPAADRRTMRSTEIGHGRLGDQRAAGRAQPDAAAGRRLPADHVLHAGDQLQHRTTTTSGSTCPSPARPGRSRTTSRSPRTGWS